MNKKVVISVVVLLVLAGGGIALALSHKNSTKNSDMSNMPATSTSTKSAAQTNSVTIENFAFSPANITIKKGTTVTWTNKDSIGHTVTEDSGSTTNNGDPGMDSKVLAQGESYKATFNAVGTFKYHCSIHPNMTGTVTVTE